MKIDKNKSERKKKEKKETNGKREIPKGTHWITIKTNNININMKQKECSEYINYLNGYDTAHNPTVKSNFYLLMPVREILDDEVNKEALNNCIKNVYLNPNWQLCMDMNKLMDL